MDNNIMKKKYIFIITMSIILFITSIVHLIIYFTCSTSVSDIMSIITVILKLPAMLFIVKNINQIKEQKTKLHLLLLLAIIVSSTINILL